MFKTSKNSHFYKSSAVFAKKRKWFFGRKSLLNFKNHENFKIKAFFMLILKAFAAHALSIFAFSKFAFSKSFPHTYPQFAPNSAQKLRGHFRHV